MNLTGKITAAEMNPSGKSLKITFEGVHGEESTVFAKKPNLGLMEMVGQTVQYSVYDSEFQGRTNQWIETFKTTAPSVNQVNSAPQTSPNKINPASYMPFVSNGIAHAIQAGLIKNIGDVGVWTTEFAKAGRNAVSGETPTTEGDVPF
tara:strand:- start:331 stop:774 length:444 start_codon:yes stop_codon:yes gene_type:complete